MILVAAGALFTTADAVSARVKRIHIYRTGPEVIVVGDPRYEESRVYVRRYELAPDYYWRPALYPVPGYVTCVYPRWKVRGCRG
jgi:hypothetical protein